MRAHVNRASSCEFRIVTSLDEGRSKSRDLTVRGVFHVRHIEGAYDPVASVAVSRYFKARMSIGSETPAFRSTIGLYLEPFPRVRGEGCVELLLLVAERDLYIARSVLRQLNLLSGA